MPAFRLAHIIEENLKRVEEVLCGLNFHYEIIPVDDGSGDGTPEILSRLTSETIRPIVLKKNSGKGNALRHGVKASRGDMILLLDADLDLTPELLPRFLDEMEKTNADIIIGSKRHPESIIDYPFSRRLASRVYYGIVRILTGLPVTDTQTGMKLFRREAIDWAFNRMLVKHYAFDVELLSIAHDAGFVVKEAPIKMEYGNKKGALTFHNVKTVLIDTLAIFYRLKVLRYYQNVELSELSEPPPEVSVVIACPECTSYLEEAMAGLSVQSLKPTEIIVIPDEPFEPPSHWPKEVRIIPSGKKRPSEKRNLGAEEARGEIIAFLDDDAMPDPAWLSQAVRHFSREDVGATGGPAVTPQNDSRFSRLGGDVYASPLVSGTCRFRYTPERFRYVDDLPSCNLLVRRSLMKEIGGFNTRYWPGEDTILCLDIVNAGFKIIYNPFATVFHHRRPLFGAHLRQIGRYAMHRGFFARIFAKTSRRISYMIPSLFVLGIVLGPIAAAFVPVLFPIYFGVIAFYLIVTFLASVHRNPVDWLIVWAGIILTHLWYGIRFIQGLFFGKMPHEVRAFDHGGTKKQEG